MRWQTVIIHFPNWNTKSVKICDISTGVIKWIMLPRNDIWEFWEKYIETKPWIYFLIWEKSEVWKFKIYVWEAENLFTRIKQHNFWKEFWNSVIVFFSDKTILNKANIKFLENYCYQQLKSINKCDIENCVNPTQSKISIWEEDTILTVFDQIKLILSTLWINIFDEEEIKEENLYFCKMWNIEAKWIYWEEWITVLKWSLMSTLTSKSFQWWNKIFEKLKQNKILWQEWENYIFLEDYIFSSPSAASSLVLGRNSNGWTERKDKNWKTLDEKIRKQI